MASPAMIAVWNIMKHNKKKWKKFNKHSPESLMEHEKMHEELLQSFMEYFNAHQTWCLKGTKKAGIEMRVALSKIWHNAIDRRKMIKHWEFDLDPDNQKPRYKLRKDDN